MARKEREENGGGRERETKGEREKASLEKAQGHRGKLLVTEFVCSALL